MTVQVLPFGETAVLVEYPDLPAALRAYRGLATSTPRGVVDLVPAARTVLVRFDPTMLGTRAVTRWVLDTAPVAVESAVEQPIVVPVTYDGADLESTAETLGLGADELVRRHTTATWTSAFIGFAPGFAYLVAHDLDLAVPRRATSRERVPAGSVALAGAFSGVYPRESPGGWQLIGRTDVDLWNTERTPPALLAPGVRVRFEAVG
ncbi:KipI family sensor histidine kinase inhibitor [Diaminobutyricimonas aerilata]|uniref:KipI family sensor histidine kinase inhibitor n=1 Tax=Diaminobutyricimonas aerilata TaxID=1162967 RepID=A0A2M9CMF5_9MICO|nr:allophanate hydrolase subunit 1 [Diaminobutyricimonas aerilata]PJJ73087.1 KipI family sensor histidine kinase inhibitor [Diaminobutyricimonas aerilata]